MLYCISDYEGILLHMISTPAPPYDACLWCSGGEAEVRKKEAKNNNANSAPNSVSRSDHRGFGLEVGSEG